MEVKKVQPASLLKYSLVLEYLIVGTEISDEPSQQEKTRQIFQYLQLDIDLIVGTEIYAEASAVASLLKCSLVLKYLIVGTEISDEASAVTGEDGGVCRNKTLEY